MLGYYRHNFRPLAARAVRSWARRPLSARSAAAPRRAASHRLPTPALVVWGARDPALPDAVRASVVRDLHGCPCIVVPHAGHFVLEEAPEIAIPAIASFVRGEDREAGSS
jgi:pimeloyl-ACP methyl ester carboxylesterase